MTTLFAFPDARSGLNDPEVDMSHMSFATELSLFCDERTAKQRMEQAFHDAGYEPWREKSLHYYRGSRRGSWTSFSPRNWRTDGILTIQPLALQRVEISLQIAIDISGQTVSLPERDFWQEEFHFLLKRLLGDEIGYEVVRQRAAHAQIYGYLSLLRQIIVGSLFGVGAVISMALLALLPSEGGFLFVPGFLLTLAFVIYGMLRIHYSTTQASVFDVDAQIRAISVGSVFGVGAVVIMLLLASIPLDKGILFVPGFLLTLAFVIYAILRMRQK